MSLLSWTPSAATAPLVSAMAYSFCSVSMVLVNKAVLSRFDFSSPASLLVLQGSVVVAVMYAARRRGLVQFKDITQDRAKKWFPVNLLFIAMLFTSFKTLEHLSVPMVTVFKNLTNILTMFGAYRLFGESASWGVIASLCITLLAALLAGHEDLDFDLTGYFWMALNCICTSGYVLYMRASSAASFGMSVFDKTAYNNTLMLPTAGALAIVLGEVPGVFHDSLFLNPTFVLAVVFSGAVGFFLNLASLWCVEQTGATTYSMVGAMNKIPVALLGTVLFDYNMTTRGWVYVGVALAGGVLYAYVKAQERIAAGPPPPPPASGSGAGGEMDVNEEALALLGAAEEGNGTGNGVEMHHLNVSPMRVRGGMTHARRHSGEQGGDLVDDGRGRSSTRTSAVELLDDVDLVQDGVVPPSEEERHQAPGAHSQHSS